MTPALDSDEDDAEQLDVYGKEQRRALTFD